MTTRLTGLSSGMDTETLIKGMMDAQKLKNKKTTDKQTKLTWQQDKWKELNTKLYKLYTEDISKMRLEGNYQTKKVTSSNDELVSVKGSAGATEGAHTLVINNLATSQYVTGGKIAATSTSKLTGLGVTAGTIINIGSATAPKTLTVDANTTIADFVSTAKEAGLNASFDASQGRFFISSKESGEANSFQITATTLANPTAMTTIEDDILDKIGYASLPAEDKVKADNAITTIASELSTAADITAATQVLANMYSPADKTEINTLTSNYRSSSLDANTQMGKLGLDILNEDGSKINTASTLAGVSLATDSSITYNGATLTGSSNVITANGLTITLKGETAGKTLNLNVTNDTQGTYDMVKKFITSYNDILKEMNTLYYADSTRSYAPLSDDDKEAMTDDEITKWETKIKNSILRRDTTVGSLLDSMKNAMSTKVTGTADGKSYSLSSYGIQTSTDYSEKGLLHINGNKEDATYSNQPDKLMKALEGDPDTVMEVLSGISKNLYDTMNDKMSSIPNVRSAFTFYNDKTMATQQTAYTKQVKMLEAKLTATEDKYYKQFAAMESAMAKMQSQSSALTNMLGTSS